MPIDLVYAKTFQKDGLACTKMRLCGVGVIYGYRPKEAQNPSSLDDEIDSQSVKNKLKPEKGTVSLNLEKLNRILL